MNALQNLFDKALAVASLEDSREWMYLLIKGTKGIVEPRSKTTIFGPHEVRSPAVLAIHRLIASVTCLVTPKLLWRL